MKNESKNKKSKSVKPIPKGYHTVTPFLIVNGAASLLEFITKAFGGKISFIMKGDDGKVSHATIKVGDSIIMVSDASERFQATSSMLHLYVEDVDSVYQSALDARGISLREPTDEFYGDRSAGVMDAWENQWWIATHTEDLSDEEMQARKEKSTEQAVTQ